MARSLIKNPRHSSFVVRLVGVVAALVGTLASGPLHAQIGGGMGGGMQQGGGMGGMGGGMGGMGGGMGGMGGGMGGMGGGMPGMGGFGFSPPAGVLVDANGVLRMQSVADGGLSVERRKAAVAAFEGDLQKNSKLRKVALSRLEAEVRKAVESGRGVPEAMEKLAGLTRVQYVFVYPAEDGRPGEIVIAGPAEPWITDATGRVRGVETGWPTVLLEDLAAAIRAFAPGQPQDRQIGCSIDPKPEGLAAMQAYLKKVGRVNPKGGTEAIVSGMKDALGTQTVSVFGVSPATHFAQVLVEADYRMKLIGIGLEPAPAKMKTWVELTSGGAGQNALQRWYFLPDYQCVKIAEDDLAIQLVGQGVKLCGADEVVMPDGRRLDANRADGASRTFTQTFTKKYPEIAARNPVYAQLRTLIDLAVVAAYMQEHDAYGKASWGAETLRDEQAYRIERLETPREVETAINAVWRGSKLITPIGGGVTMHPRMALDATNLLLDDKGDVAATRAAAKDLPVGRWWWD
jgi:hypothetical protein